MSALGQNRTPDESVWRFKEYTLSAGFIAWQGSELFFDPSTQEVSPVPGDGKFSVGFSIRKVDATAGAKTVNVDLREEFLLTYYANATAGDACAATDIGRDAYFVDDQTVSPVPEGRNLAGRIMDVHATKGIGVRVRRSTRELAKVPANAALGSFAANDLAPTNLENGAVYDIPATAGVSTVTLPVAALDGTQVTFVADGTKNGHTVQYRDATGPTALTTALVASKRHLVVCVKRDGKWFANAYVSP